MRSAVHILVLIVVASAIVASKGRADVLNPVDRSVFVRDLEVQATGPHLPGRPEYPYAGTEVVIKATSLPGDIVTWFHQGKLLPAETGPELRLVHVSESHAGAYWAQITRDGHEHETDGVSISIATPPTRSVVDTRFTNQFDNANEGWDYALTVLDSSGRIGYIRYPGVFFSGSFGWMQPDGSAIQNVFEWQFPGSNLGDFSGLLQDGSFLLNGTGQIDRVWPDGSRAPLTYLGQHPLERQQWTLLTNRDPLHTTTTVLIRLPPDGSERWLYRPADYGLAQFRSATPLQDGSSRLLLIGAKADSAETLTLFALVLDADGKISPDVAGMTLHDRPELVHQTDGTWVAVSEDAVRHFNADGSLRSDRSLGDWANLKWTALPDGHLYGAWSDIGVLRLRLDTLERDDSFYALFPPGTGLSANTPLLTDDGSLYFAAKFSSVDLHATRLVTKLDSTATAAGLSPVVNISVQETPVGGSPVKIVGIAIGEGPLTYEWINLDQPLSTPQTGRVLRLAPYSLADTGRYVLKVTGAKGIGYSNVWDLRPTTPPLIRNLSGRARVTSAAHPLLAGFVVEQRDLVSPDRTAPSRYFLLRGIGPALADYGITAPLPDPVLTLRRTDGTAIAGNDDWEPITSSEGLIAATAAAFPLASDSRDAHLFLARSRGAQVLEVAGKPGDGGIALAEIYQLGDTDQGVELSNLSLRGRTGVGDDMLTGGFVIDDPSGLGRSVRLLLRAVGPGLDAFGVEETCEDPVLKLFDRAGNLIATSDNWGDHTPAEQLAVLASTLGAFALMDGSTDAALAIELPPGVYTAQASSGTATNGEILLELYRTPVD